MSDHLTKQNIDVVLSGERCVSVYSHNWNQSFDLYYFDDHGAKIKNLYPDRKGVEI